MERREILLGSVSLMCTSIVSGIIAWYAAHGGKYLTIYYTADEHGWLWFFLQVPVIFLCQVSIGDLFQNNRTSYEDTKQTRACQLPLVLSIFL